jgi:uncharacterized protein YeaO (DUF488 family)
VKIELRRVYDPPSSTDGSRFLVDRLWPRGVVKVTLGLTAWLKDAAPSNELRKKFHNRPELWDEFRRAYFSELQAHPETWAPLVDAARRDTVTLLYAAKNAERNNAVVLKEFLEDRLR